MPIGFLITLVLVVVGVAVSLRPPSRSGLRGLLAWLVSAIPNESPFLVAYWLAASTLIATSQGGLHGSGVWVSVGAAAALLAGTPILLRRSLGTVPAVEQALDRDIGPQWREASRVKTIARNPPPWLRIVLTPLPVFHPGVRRTANLSYGDAGRRNRLDLYQSRARCNDGPVLIHLHGGGFSLAPGRKSFYARRMLFRLARHGWVCISATYRLAPSANFPDDLVDVKKVIAWARVRR